MILITPEETSSPLNEDIERLQTNLRGFARDIENLQERVQSGDVTDAETRNVFSDLRSWLRMAMETEKALAQQNRQRLEIDGDDGLDLDAARDQIGCRLCVEYTTNSLLCKALIYKNVILSISYGIFANFLCRREEF